MAGLREYLNSPAGKWIVGGAVLLIVVVAVVVLRGMMGPSLGQDVAGASFIDAATGQEFKHTVKVGDKIPIRAPSGKDTGYLAEMCYWGKDGKPKDTPSYVLLNQYVNKPEPTFCPDCGRLVVPMNPRAAAGQKPPPTEAEYKARRTNDEEQ